jgi:hypothetical protein
LSDCTGRAGCARFSKLASRISFGIRLAIGSAIGLGQACQRHNAAKKVIFRSLLLDRVPDFRRDVRPVEPRNGADAEEQQCALARRGAEVRANFTLAWRKIGDLCWAAAKSNSLEAKKAPDDAGA